ncbi:MAG: hypothetical protein IPM35_10190 [Myxococcales bacterium]|nr:hypothetical protein [Myxococcales bacterium]
MSCFRCCTAPRTARSLRGLQGVRDLERRDPAHVERPDLRNARRSLAISSFALATPSRSRCSCTRSAARSNVLAFAICPALPTASATYRASFFRAADLLSERGGTTRTRFAVHQRPARTTRPPSKKSLRSWPPI